MENLTEVKRDLLAECQEDYVGLWSIVARIRRVGIIDDSAVREAALDVLRPLLSEERIAAGQFVARCDQAAHPRDEYRFEIWKKSPEEVILNIETEWAKLGRDPALGEIVWFTSRKQADSSNLEATAV